MYCPDLTQRCPVDDSPDVRAIGWLDGEHPFATGAVAPEFLEAIRRHIEEAWAPVRTCGVHFCEVCARARPGERRHAAGGNLWIPAQEYVYVAPELILHYIEAHQYRPPDAFVAAVLVCPPQGSEEYMRLLGDRSCWLAGGPGCRLR